MRTSFERSVPAIGVRGWHSGVPAPFGSPEKSCLLMVLAAAWMVGKGRRGKCPRRRTVPREFEHVCEAPGQRLLLGHLAIGRCELMAGETPSLAPALTPTEFATIVTAHLMAKAEVKSGTLDWVCPIIERFGTFTQAGLGITSIQDVQP